MLKSASEAPSLAHRPGVERLIAAPPSNTAPLLASDMSSSTQESQPETLLACDHGYNCSRLADGSDPYSDTMNRIIRHILTAPTLAGLCEIMFSSPTTDTDKKIIGKKLLAFGLMRCSGRTALSKEERKNLCSTIMGMGYMERLSIDQLKKLMGTLNCERSIRLFLYQRASCSCFDGLRVWAERTLPSIDICENKDCLNVLPFDELFDCAKCRFTSYCSAMCQAKDWPFHKPHCKNWRKLQAREDAVSRDENS